MQRIRVVVEAETLDILLLHAKLRYEQHREASRTAAGRRPKAARVTPRICELLNRKTMVVGRVWTDYWNGQAVTVAPLSGNYAAKTTLVPRVAMVAARVQEFVRDRRAIRQRTVARGVMGLLVSMKVIDINYESATAVASAERSVRRYLQHIGYKRGKKKCSLSYKLREENAQKRDVYLSTMMRVKEDQMQRVVYLDESHVHQNYARHDDSLYDTNDYQDLQVTVKHKGRRYCFIAAIVSEDPTIETSKQSHADRAQLLEETLDIFEGEKKQTKYYHGMFNGEYFERWMVTLLDTLDIRDIKNAYIVMDNAKYHCRLPPETPTGKTKKADMLVKCKEWGINTDTKELKKSQWAKLKERVRLHVAPVVVRGQLEENDLIAHDRVLVENYFGRLTSLWAVASDKYRWSESSYDTLFKTCVALTNFHVHLNPLRSADGDSYSSYLGRLLSIGEDVVAKRKTSQKRYRSRRGQRLHSMFCVRNESSGTLHERHRSSSSSAESDETVYGL